MLSAEAEGCFTVFIKQSSAEKLNAFLKKVSLNFSISCWVDEAN